jgi:hypothetical protein
MDLKGIKNSIFWDVAEYGHCRTDVSEKHIAYIFRVERISELVTTLA